MPNGGIGTQGPQGLQGLKGDTGAPGTDGKDGQSIVASVGDKVQGNLVSITFNIDAETMIYTFDTGGKVTVSGVMFDGGGGEEPRR